jgi:hypothetical protein
MEAPEAALDPFPTVSLGNPVNKSKKEGQGPPGPRPSIDGLVVCAALRLALAQEASSSLCCAPYVPDGDASVGAGALYLREVYT